MHRLKYAFENLHFAMIYTVQVDDLIDFYPFYIFEIVEPNNKFWPFLLETSVRKAMQSPQKCQNS